MDAAITTVLNELETISFLKDEQSVALKAFVGNNDVFAVLPTGFGKSLIYQLAPLVGKKLGLSETPVVIVVSPLLALMDDQIKEATECLSARSPQRGRNPQWSSTNYFW